jgi:hypothetical protein
VTELGLDGSRDSGEVVVMRQCFDPEGVEFQLPGLWLHRRGEEFELDGGNF